MDDVHGMHQYTELTHGNRAFSLLQWRSVRYFWGYINIQRDKYCWSPAVLSEGILVGFCGEELLLLFSRFFFSLFCFHRFFITLLTCRWSRCCRVYISERWEMGKTLMAKEYWFLVLIGLLAKVELRSLVLGCYTSIPTHSICLITKDYLSLDINEADLSQYWHSIVEQNNGVGLSVFWVVTNVMSYKQFRLCFKLLAAIYSKARIHVREM